MSADFKMIRPASITDAVLTSTNVPEAVVSTYSGATTYAAGDRAGAAPVDGAAQTVWESLQPGNTGNAQTEGAWWTEIGVVYPAYSGAVAYVIGNTVSDLTNHLLYEAVANSTGAALTDTTKWLNIGATNAWAIFDDTYGSQTTNAESIEIVLTPGVLVNTAFLGNLDAASVTATQSVSGWTETITLNSHPVNNWYDWYYEPLIRKEIATFTSIPPYPASTLTIAVDNPGGTAAYGICVVGQSVTFGKTQWEVMGGILSYSGTSTDTFGNTTFVPRASAKRLNLDVHITAGFEDEAYRLLTLYTDTPMVFIGSSDYDMTVAYGYLGSWEVPISNSGRTAPIEIRGLI